MQIAVASNIHGNLPALASILSKIERLKEDGRDIGKLYILGVFGFMPYPKEVFEMIKGSNGLLTPVRGKYDHLIARWGEMDEREKEDLKEDLPDFAIEMIEWNWQTLGHEGRSWIRNDVPAFISEKFGDNEFFFVYGDPFNPVNGEIQPKRSSAYYEQFLAPFKKYEVIVVAGREPFVAETKYGRLVCPGSAGLQPIRGTNPTFAVIDTRTTDVAIFEFEFSKSDVEERIKEAGLPEQIKELLYHGYL